MLKRLFAYIRVSDPKQGKGVSLQEQRSVIEAYAARIGVSVVGWFVELRTAGKAGRPEFTRMVHLIRRGDSDGFVVHKLDRSTRNWYDWAEINQLLDAGVFVHEASTGNDLLTNGSRLAADMEIVVAVHYLRNLRLEALKGIEGRLKQGILPNAAGIGYLDRGAGNPKEIDPVKGPLVKQVFELAASGAYALRSLAVEAEKIGLRNRSGRPLWMQEIQKVLRNPFYVGIIRSKRFGDFPGAHVPLISRAVFDRVQEVLDGRFVRRTKRHSFQFRRLIRCKTCGRALIGSERKGWIYYRCSTVTCPTTSLREDRIDEAVRGGLRQLSLSRDGLEKVQEELRRVLAEKSEIRIARRAAIAQTIASAKARLSRLTDLLIDGKIDTEAHDERRATLLADIQRAEQELASIDAGDDDMAAVTAKIVGLAKSPELLYESAEDAEKRQLLEIVMSDCVAGGKTLEFTAREPFVIVRGGGISSIGGPLYDTHRTFSAEELIQAVDELPREVRQKLRRIRLAAPAVS